jgi:predicted nucleotidyltransferase
MDARNDDLDRIRIVLRATLPNLEARHGVESLAVFGSVARGDAEAGSDVDVLVRFQGEPPTLFEFVRLERQLSDLLDRPVDLVMETALKPRLRARILAECVAA